MSVILAIDTATDWTGLALHADGAVVAEYGWRSRRVQTVELSPAIAQMWQRAGLGAADLEAIAVAIGPGSYTGLRVGLSVAKGLALSHNLKLVGVPTLDIVAAGVTPYEGNLIVVAEAGRLRLWTGRYRWQERGGWKATGEPALSQWEQLLAELERPTLFAGEVSSEAAKQIRRNRLGRLVSPAATVRRAGYLAEIGSQRLKAGQVDDPRALAPRYLRQPA